MDRLLYGQNAWSELIGSYSAAANLNPNRLTNTHDMTWSSSSSSSSTSRFLSQQTFALVNVFRHLNISAQREGFCFLPSPAALCGGRGFVFVFADICRTNCFLAETSALVLNVDTEPFFFYLCKEAKSFDVDGDGVLGTGFEIEPPDVPDN